MNTAVAATRLRSFIERIERLEDDKDDIAIDIRGVYSEAKGEGFDAKVLRKIVARRQKDAAQVREEEELFDLYLSAIGDAPRKRRDERQIDIEDAIGAAA